MTTPSISDLQAAERIFDSVADKWPMLSTDYAVASRDLKFAIAAALCEQRDAEYQTLTKIDNILTHREGSMASGVIDVIRVVRDRLAELTGGGTEEQR